MNTSDNLPVRFPPRWVWLDLDDTLVDFHANSDAALKRVYHEWNLDRYYATDDEWLDSYHEVNTALWRLYDAGAITQSALRMERFRRPLVSGGMDDAIARRVSIELDPAYLGYLSDGKAVIPGARELLVALRKHGLEIGVLSNGFSGVQERKLESVGFDTLVDLVVLSDDIGVNKPDGRLYRHAMERAGITLPAAHLMVGDNPATDIAGAIGAGWGAILFDRHGRYCETADYPVVGDLADVLPCIFG